MKKFSLITLGFAAALTSTAQAAIISFNYTGSDEDIPPTGVAGVVLAQNWNNERADDLSLPLTDTVTDLVDNSGAATTMDVSYEAFNEAYVASSEPGVDGDGRYNREMLDAYLNSGEGTSTGVTETSINLSDVPYLEYDLYVYVKSDVADREGSVTVGDSSIFFRTAGGAGIEPGDDGVARFIEMTDTTDQPTNSLGNYAVFRGLSGANQTITTDIPEYGGIAGFQVVEVPEPSAAMLGGLSLLGLLARRRR